VKDLPDLWAGLSKPFHRASLSGETKALRNTELQREHRASTSVHSISKQKRLLFPARWLHRRLSHHSSSSLRSAAIVLQDNL